MRTVGHVPRPPIGVLSDPQALYPVLQQFLAWMREKQYSEHSVESYEKYLYGFIRWADERGLVQPREVTRPILERYQRHLFLYRKRNGQPLSVVSQRMSVQALQAWFKWQVKSYRLLVNPAGELEMPRKAHRLPKVILTVDEVERVLNGVDVSTALGVRDRAMLETLYSTGMRRMELITLTVHAIDVERGTVMIREGKGKRDRVVPLGERASAWVVRYRDTVRPCWALGGDDGTLFLTPQGSALTGNQLTHRVHAHVDAAELGKRGSCHLFRHTMATLMLEGGADVRYVQAMLGHASLEATQIYTKVVDPGVEGDPHGDAPGAATAAG